MSAPEAALPILADRPVLEPSCSMRDYQLQRSLRGVIGLLATASEGSAESNTNDPTQQPEQVLVRTHGQTVELVRLSEQEYDTGDHTRVRLCASLSEQGGQTRVALTVHKPCFVEAMMRGDIVPEAVGWCAALAISVFQGLISHSVEASLVSFGISALGLLAVRLGTAFSVWRRAQRSVRRDLNALLHLVHAKLAPEERESVTRY